MCGDHAAIADDDEVVPATGNLAPWRRRITTLPASRARTLRAISLPAAVTASQTIAPGAGTSSCHAVSHSRVIRSIASPGECGRAAAPGPLAAWPPVRAAPLTVTRLPLAW
jgi:hypothetical protein